MGVDNVDAGELAGEPVQPRDLAEVIGLCSALDEADIPEHGDAKLLNRLPERHIRSRSESGRLGARPEAVVVQVEGGQAEIAVAAIQVSDLGLLLQLALID